MKIYLPYILLVVLSLSACSEEGDELKKQQWVEREVYKRIQSFKQEKKKECYLEILKAVETEVDSILAQKDLFGNVLDKEVPIIPSKPEYVPLDSTEFQNHQVTREKPVTQL